MSFGFNLQEKVVEFFNEHPGYRATTMEIAKWIVGNASYEEECQEKLEQSIVANNMEDLVRTIATEISARRLILERRRGIKTTEDKPMKFFQEKFTENAKERLTENQLHIPSYILGKAPSYTKPSKAFYTSNKVKEQVKEHELYQKLTDFLWFKHNIHSKRIDEKRSSNSRGKCGNKWLHPDLVGMENLSQEWHEEIKHCVKEYADKKSKLWAFEVKVDIKSSNLRECFFQTVSNSSWANFGYLVASRIDGEDTLRELRMLSSLHGIGFIMLNLDDINASQIMIPAREKPDVDWDMASRLTENRDFLNYIKSVREFYQTGNDSRANWDVPSKD